MGVFATLQIAIGYLAVLQVRSRRAVRGGFLGPAHSSGERTAGELGAPTGWQMRYGVRACLPCPLQLAWWLERGSRLAYVRRAGGADAVEAEWQLERKQRPLGSLVLELAALLLLCWQVVELWLMGGLRLRYVGPDM